MKGEKERESEGEGEGQEEREGKGEGERERESVCGHERGRDLAWSERQRSELISVSFSRVR